MTRGVTLVRSMFSITSGSCTTVDLRHTAGASLWKRRPVAFGKWVAEVVNGLPQAASGQGRENGCPNPPPGADILPASALAAYPTSLDARIRTFLNNQAGFANFNDTRLTADDYLRIINGQVAVSAAARTPPRHYRPGRKIEWQYSTPCYALSVACSCLGLQSRPGLLESGLKAMDTSVNEMHEYRCAHNHGEFFIQPVMLALDPLRAIRTT